MKLLGNMLIWISLALGLVSAPSLYAWPVGADATHDARFVLGTDDDGEPVYALLKQRTVNAASGEEIGAAGAALTPEVLAAMRDAGIARATVRHPGAAPLALVRHWTGLWLFVLAAVGLAGGGLLVKAAARAALQAPDRADAPRSTPEAVAGQMREQISALRGSIARLDTDRARMAQIVAVLGEVQGELVPEFAQTRPQLIAARGMGGFARVMDTFASMERKVNRAWSAAADGAYEESAAALEEAATFAEHLCEQLASGG
ncbi:MAG: hypothetical protein KF757_03990 [Phycisphaeraceae bacterium]|nr:hypothetical protein [Phycisphaeraceae bacterium]MCW5763162.1 hypothetical protein [Phycisphaeraceae bacterium]